MTLLQSGFAKLHELESRKPRQLSDYCQNFSNNAVAILVSPKGGACWYSSGAEFW